MNFQDIKSFEDACKALNLSNALPSFPAASKTEAEALTAHYQLTVIARALNEGWTPDWTDYDENKYYPWWDLSPNDEKGFELNDVNYRYSGSIVSSRLCFKSREIAQYAADTFTDLYRAYMVIE